MARSFFPCIHLAFSYQIYFLQSRVSVKCTSSVVSIWNCAVDQRLYTSIHLTVLQDLYDLRFENIVWRRVERGVFADPSADRYHLHGQRLRCHRADQRQVTVGRRRAACNPSDDSYRRLHQRLSN